MNAKTDLKQKDHRMLIGDSLLVAMVVAVMLYTIRSLAMISMDSDTFFLITTGKYIVENGVVPTINPFVIHEGFEMIVQQWLFDVAMYWLYDTLGLCGIYLYCIAMLFLTLFALNKFLSIYTSNVDVKAFCLSLYCILWSIFLSARPTSLSFILLMSLLITIENYKKKNNPALLLWLPLISLIVINTHSAMWPMLFVLMLPYVAPESLIKFIWDALSSQFVPKSIDNIGSKKKFKDAAVGWVIENRWLLLSMLGMFIVGFINPNGIKSMIYVILSYGSASYGSEIYELKSPTLTSVFGVIVVAAIIMTVLYVQKYRDRTNIPLIYMSLGTIILSMIHIRNSWFLCFSLLPIIAILVSDLLDRNRGQNLTRKLHKIPCLVAIIILMCVVSFTNPAKIEDCCVAPVKAEEYLGNKDKDSLVLFTEFNNGAFMEFNGYKVYLDARPELFQKKINGKEDVYEEYWAVRDGECDIAQFIDKYKFTHMIVEDGTALAGFMQANSEYVAVVESEEYVLYEAVDYVSE